MFLPSSPSCVAPPRPQIVIRVQATSFPSRTACLQFQTAPPPKRTLKPPPYPGTHHFQPGPLLSGSLLVRRAGFEKGGKVLSLPDHSSRWLRGSPGMEPNPIALACQPLSFSGFVSQCSLCLHPVRHCLACWSSFVSLLLLSLVRVLLAAQLAWLPLPQF